MDKQNVIQRLLEKSAVYRKMAKDIWDHPELAYEEVYASGLQKDYLNNQGFKIENVPGIPTAFVASYGEGSPVIGLLGEYDALPGLSQKVSAVKEPVVEGAPGHGCGHNLIGVGCIAAAVAIKEELAQKQTCGTIRYFGCPAEEKGYGKSVMLKKGAFKGTDICIAWHPESANKLTKDMLLSTRTITAAFKGESSQNLMKRKLGGNAMFASELVFSGIHQLETQMGPNARIGYFVSKGAETMNVIPSMLEMQVLVRNQKYEVCEKMSQRMKEIMEGAAVMTGTEVEVEISPGFMGELYNKTLSDVLYENMKEIGHADFSEEELDFADKIKKAGVDRMRKEYIDFYHIPKEEVKCGMHLGAIRQDKIFFQPSSDVGNVSREIPTAMFFAAVVPMGVTLHNWQATAAAGSSLGASGMIYAGKVMAAAVCDLMNDKKLVEKVKDDFLKMKES